MLNRRLLGEPVLAAWQSGIAFAKHACKGRASTHNHTHMNVVVELSLLIAAQELQAPTAVGAGADEEQQRLALALVQRHQEQLRRVVIVAALHDVNDHKYNTPEMNLEKEVEDYVATQFAASEADAKLCLLAIDAISFSKEKKRGHRWFEEPLGAEWTEVRNIVSDADKLLAIGHEGLSRCWTFGIELVLAGRAVGLPEGAVDPADGKTPREGPALVQWLTHRTIEHFDEKLVHLLKDYFRTPTGKMMGQLRHDEMVEIVEGWRKGHALPTTMAAPMFW